MVATVVMSPIYKAGKQCPGAMWKRIWNMRVKSNSDVGMIAPRIQN
ncbi:hypothetical protein chiPu_0027187, partial [Chiloscyllium punctatum]|nr:hypothetical protein [Chiloscyllium punctatum]